MVLSKNDEENILWKYDVQKDKYIKLGRNFRMPPFIGLYSSNTKSLFQSNEFEESRQFLEMMSNSWNFLNSWKWRHILRIFSLFVNKSLVYLHFQRLFAKIFENLELEIWNFLLFTNIGPFIYIFYIVCFNFPGKFLEMIYLFSWSGFKVWP